MKKIILVAAVSVFTIINLNAQELLSPSFSYSHDRTSYITLSNGEEIKGKLDDLDRKKGLIEEVTIIDEKGGKHVLTPEEIEFMYLYPSGMDQVGKASRFLSDSKRWTDNKLNQDFLSQGYIYLEKSPVKVKKNEMILLMQLLNPDYSKKVKVYHDPLAKETTQLGVGPMTVSGGNAKSYYVKVGDDVAFRLYKKDYKEKFNSLWSKCEDLVNKTDRPDWKDFTQNVLDYTDCVE